MNNPLFYQFIAFHGEEKIKNWLVMDGIIGLLRAYTSWLIEMKKLDEDC